jgi:peptidoglycan/LPS O-acetylase OafA/YrhL
MSVPARWHGQGGGRRVGDEEHGGMTATHRLAPLDGLRGIAILLVVWYHVWQITWLPAPHPALEFLPETGFAGVDLFFFLSGFVISYPFLVARDAGTPQPTWGHFARRRLIKIVPSYVLSMVVLIATGYAHFDSFGAAAASIATHLFFVHTWWQATFGSINGVLWSLAVEVQFYVVFPLVWWCFRRSAFSTAGALVAIALAWRSAAAHCCLHTTMPLMVENLPGYVDLFAAGMLSAFAYVRFHERLRGALATSVATAVAIAGIALFWLLAQNLYDARLGDMWPYAWQIVLRSAWAFAFILIATGTLLGARWWQNVVGNPLLIFCGAISYNWYLYHQAIARGLLAAHLPPYATANAVNDPHWQVAFTALAFALTFVQATALTFLFERPLLNLRWRVRLGSRATAAQ